MAQLGFERDSWVAAVDARRLKPTEDTDEVAVEQARVLIGRLHGDLEWSPFSSSMPSLRSGEAPALIVVRLHSKRVF